MSKGIFISCLKASELIEKKNISSLGLFEKAQLKVHQIICKGCAVYEKHSRLLEEGAKKIIRRKIKELRLSGEVKENIISKLED